MGETIYESGTRGVMDTYAVSDNAFDFIKKRTWNYFTNRVAGFEGGTDSDMMTLNYLGIFLTPLVMVGYAVTAPLHRKKVDYEELESLEDLL